MRVAIAQINMDFENKEYAMGICRELMAEAKEKGVDFIVFPEMTLPGFTLNPETYGEDRQNSKTIAFFQEEAKKNGVAVCSLNNKFKVGDELEVVGPDLRPFTIHATDIRDEEGNTVEDPRHPEMKFTMQLPKQVPALSMIRRSVDLSAK